MQCQKSQVQRKLATTLPFSSCKLREDPINNSLKNESLGEPSYPGLFSVADELYYYPKSECRKIISLHTNHLLQKLEL